MFIILHYIISFAKNQFWIMKFVVWMIPHVVVTLLQSNVLKCEIEWICCFFIYHFPMNFNGNFKYLFMCIWIKFFLVLNIVRLTHSQVPGWTHLRVHQSVVAESWDSKGAPDFQHYKGVEGHARSPGIRLGRGTNRSSLNLHQDKPQSG